VFARLRERRALAVLPASVARFYGDALAVARERGHAWGIEAATRPAELRTLLDLAAGARLIVELGTGPAWTTAALALGQPQARVVSYDPVVHDHRDAYLALVPRDVRSRIEFVQAPGAAGAAAGAGPVDLLFIDSTHEREGTLAEFRAWRPRLASGAVVAFHDHGHPDFPGVAEAVAQLGLDGEAHGGLYAWRAS